MARSLGHISVRSAPGESSIDTVKNSYLATLYDFTRSFDDAACLILRNAHAVWLAQLLLPLEILCEKWDTAGDVDLLGDESDPVKNGHTHFHSTVHSTKADHFHSTKTNHFHSTKTKRGASLHSRFSKDEMFLLKKAWSKQNDACPFLTFIKALETREVLLQTLLQLATLGKIPFNGIAHAPTFSTPSKNNKQSAHQELVHDIPNTAAMPSAVAAPQSPVSWDDLLQGLGGTRPATGFESDDDSAVPSTSREQGLLDCLEHLALWQSIYSASARTAANALDPIQTWWSHYVESLFREHVSTDALNAGRRILFPVNARQVTFSPAKRSLNSLERSAQRRRQIRADERAQSIVNASPTMRILNASPSKAARWGLVQNESHMPLSRGLPAAPLYRKGSGRVHPRAPPPNKLVQHVRAKNARSDMHRKQVHPRRLDRAPSASLVPLSRQLVRSESASFLTKRPSSRSTSDAASEESHSRTTSSGFDLAAFERPSLSRRPSATMMQVPRKRQESAREVVPREVVPREAVHREAVPREVAPREAVPREAAPLEALVDPDVLALLGEPAPRQPEHDRGDGALVEATPRKQRP